MSLARPAGRRSGIHPNPVRPKDKRTPIPVARREELAAYRWSSHPAYAAVAGAAATAWLCLDWFRYFGRTRRASQQEYRRQVDQAFGHVIPSPWDDLRDGLVLGGESLWNRARKLLDQAGGHEKIRWRRRADGNEVSRLIVSLVAQEADRRVAIWLRVRVGGQRMTELAKEYGYRDGSGGHRVVHRLEEASKEDRDLAHRLQQLADRVSSVKS